MAYIYRLLFTAQSLSHCLSSSRALERAPGKQFRVPGNEVAYVGSQERLKCHCRKNVLLFYLIELRQISRIKIYTDENLGLYFAIFSYKHNLLFSNVCRLNLCLAGPLQSILELLILQGTKAAANTQRL